MTAAEAARPLARWPARRLGALLGRRLGPRSERRNVLRVRRLLATRLGFALAARLPRLVLAPLLARGAADDAPSLGLLGEALAAHELRRRGVRVLAHRRRTRHGEVDLVALERGVAVAVEVKAGRLRRAPGGGLDLRWRPGLRVDTRRIRRLARSAAALAGELGLARGRSRVDLVEVLVDPLTRELRFLVTSGLARPLSSPAPGSSSSGPAPPPGFPGSIEPPERR